MSELAGTFDFVSRVLQFHGSLVESAGGTHLDALLTADLRERLEAPNDLVHFVDGRSADSNELPCGYGSEALGKLVDLAVGSGRVVAVDAHVPDRELPVESPLTPINIACRAFTSRGVRAETLVATAQYTAIGDDERIGEVRAALSTPGSVPVPPPDPDLAPVEFRPIEAGSLEVGRIEAALPPLLVELRRRVMAELHAFRVALARRKGRDAKRLLRYFTDMVGDLSRRQRRSSSAQLRSKLESLPGEFERRLDQLRSDTALRVRLDLLGLEVVRAPGRILEIEAKRRKKSRSLEVMYDGLARRWVGLRCDGCGRTTLAIALCDEAEHVLCAACWDRCGTGGHRRCFRCAGRPERREWTTVTSPVAGTRKAAASRGASRPSASPSIHGSPSESTAATGGSSVDLRSPHRANPAAELGTLQQRIAQVLRRRGEALTSGEIRKEIPVDAPTLRGALDPLLRSGDVESSGERRGRRYRWVDDSSE